MTTRTHEETGDPNVARSLSPARHALLGRVARAGGHENSNFPLERVTLHHPHGRLTELKRGRINISQDLAPLLSREEVFKQTGLDLGTLRTVVDLPIPMSVLEVFEEFRPEPRRLYCFERESTAAPGRHRTDDRPTRFTIVTSEGLSLIKAIQDGEPLHNRLTNEMAVLDEGDENGQTRLNIGRAGWLPGLGTDHSPDVPEFIHFSARQAVLGVADGQLYLEDYGGRNPTYYVAAPQPPRLQPQ